MSTYLAAWAIVSDTYGRLTDSTNQLNVLIYIYFLQTYILFQATVWARRESTDKNHTAFSLEIASKSLPFFTKYFNTSEPIPPKTGKSQLIV